MKIRTGTPLDEAQATAVLTLAFSNDPMARWSLPDAAKFLAAFPLLTKAFGGSSFEGGTSFIAEGFAGAALWLPPGVGPDDESLVRILVENASDDIKDDMPKIFEQMEEFHPAEPHWYLPMIGVDPARQGDGVGSALMAEALKVIDRNGAIAYLESSNPRNISLYKRHGFEVIGEIQSGSSPTVRPMLRKAR
ncbi:GNAT family N-acetyltransferase [Niastella populi]|uniref:GNAT family N-acetyltransferase n=1 Tax=Niastella populi TaxID=550983 RepID=A0A1V9EWI6_9BACT|nr:N-acetyltransferase [Niastella populi]OQP50245.1 GNAT family N-acetyltransferase [Niastella populi]